ncbi:Pancreatic lipase-related protein 1 [Sarcoptes scabiei]|nr:Pancreatic lipase-related protein 1 [Sarcoptes scabiei]
MIKIPLLNPHLFNKIKCLVQQSFRYKLKSSIQRPLGDRFEIIGREFIADEWTNVPRKVIEIIERNDPLFMIKDNPIYLIKKSLEKHFNDFEFFYFRDPVVDLWQNFDSILVPKDHISRSRTDSFYVDSQHVLRSHTSAHQSQCFRYFSDRNNDEPIKFCIVGDVYRRDEVNNTHHAIFHQAEIVRLYSGKDFQFLSSKDMFDQSNDSRMEDCQEHHRPEVIKVLESQLKSTVESYIKSLFNEEKIQMRWIPAFFPFTHPSWELEIKFSKDEQTAKWLEILGCGVIEQKILDRDGLSTRIGWALGLGLERIAMLKYSIPDIRLFWTKDTGFSNQFANLDPFEEYKYRPISSYPQKCFDLSFWLPSLDETKNQWSPNDVYAIILEIGSDLVEQVHLIDQWTRESDGRRSNCYRVVYRSHERALTNDEVNIIHRKIEQALIEELNVTIR